MRILPKFANRFSPIGLRWFLHHVAVSVINLMSGTHADSYSDPKTQLKVLEQWFTGLSNKYALFAHPDTREKLKWKDLVSKYEEGEDEVCIYIVMLAQPLSQRDLLLKFPPVIELRDRWTDKVLRSSQSDGPYDPTVNKLRIGRDTPHTVIALSNALRDYNNYRLSGTNPPTWKPYSLFVKNIDGQQEGLQEGLQDGLQEVSWDWILVNWGPWGEIKTVYIEYHDRPANPLTWEYLRTHPDEVPAYIIDLTQDALDAYYEAQGYVRKGNPGMYEAA